MVGQTPNDCPLEFEDLAARGRNVTCVAVASTDLRLCTGELRVAARTTCEALVARDEARCDALGATEGATCRREVTRWKSLLKAPLAGLTKLPSPRGTLTVRAASASPSDPPIVSVDLAGAPELARGVVVVTLRERARVELGLGVGIASSTRFAPSPNRAGHAGFAMVLEPNRSAKEASIPVLERLELEIPNEATIVVPPAACECRVIASRVDRTRGGEMNIELAGTVAQADHTYAVSLKVSTFVRDVVAETAATQSGLFSPIHPPIPAATKTVRTPPTPDTDASVPTFDLRTSDP
jgi:hypothetical protein